MTHLRNILNENRAKQSRGGIESYKKPDTRQIMKTIIIKIPLSRSVSRLLLEAHVSLRASINYARDVTGDGNGGLG